MARLGTNFHLSQSSHHTLQLSLLFLIHLLRSMCKDVPGCHYERLTKLWDKYTSPRGCIHRSCHGSLVKTPIGSYKRPLQPQYIRTWTRWFSGTKGLWIWASTTHKQVVFFVPVILFRFTHFSCPAIKCYHGKSPLRPCVERNLPVAWGSILKQLRNINNTPFTR